LADEGDGVVKEVDVGVAAGKARASERNSEVRLSDILVLLLRSLLSMDRLVLYGKIQCNQSRASSDWEELAVEERGSQEMRERESEEVVMIFTQLQELKCSCSDDDNEERHDLIELRNK
jgi:hypothetical protein